MAGAAGLLARSAHPSGDGWTVRRGGDPRNGVAAVVCGQWSCVAHLGRAALQLEFERCYVGVAAPEGGAGCVCRANWSGGCRGSGPERFAAPVEARLVLAALLRRVSGFVLLVCCCEVETAVYDDGQQAVSALGGWSPLLRQSVPYLLLP